MANGTIKRLVRDRGFGFIRDDGGQEWFFHRSAVESGGFEQLNEGQRASSVQFTPSPDDLYNVPDATMNTVTDLLLNGIVVRVNNVINVRTAA